MEKGWFQCNSLHKYIVCLQILFSFLACLLIIGIVDSAPAAQPQVNLQSQVSKTQAHRSMTEVNIQVPADPIEPPNEWAWGVAGTGFGYRAKQTHDGK